MISLVACITTSVCLLQIKKEAKGFDSVREYLNFVQQQPENYFQTEVRITVAYV